jgi:hypothetical protein
MKAGFVIRDSRFGARELKANAPSSLSLVPDSDFPIAAFLQIPNPESRFPAVHP